MTLFLSCATCWTFLYSLLTRSLRFPLHVAGCTGLKVILVERCGLGPRFTNMDQVVDVVNNILLINRFPLGMHIALGRLTHPMCD